MQAGSWKREAAPLAVLLAITNMSSRHSPEGSIAGDVEQCLPTGLKLRSRPSTNDLLTPAQQEWCVGAEKRAAGR